MDDEIRKLRKQPLNCVLAEFQYSKILKIKDLIPDIQESIRRTYPVLTETNQQTVQISGQEVSVTRLHEWIFSAQDQQSAVIIGIDRIIFVTSQYSHFPEFSDRCLSLLSILKEKAEPSLLSRIGLRYNDCIVSEESAKLKDIVAPQFLPLEELDSLGNSVDHYRTESSINTEEGTLLTRSLLGWHGLPVMLDLHQRLPIQLEFKGDKEKLVLLLDFDHFWVADNVGISFDVEVAKKHLDSLHKTAQEAFLLATTEYARNKLWT